MNLYLHGSILIEVLAADAWFEQTQLHTNKADILAFKLQPLSCASCAGLLPWDCGNVLPLLLSTQAMKLLADMVRAHLQSNFYKLSGVLCMYRTALHTHAASNY